MFRIVAVAMAVIMAVGGCVQGHSDPPTDQALRDGENGVTSTNSPLVVTKRTGAPSSEHHVWAAWTETPDGFTTLWDEFRQSAGSKPELRQDEVLLVATGESGSCPLIVRDVVVDGDSITLDLVEDVPADGGCTDDFRPVTFVLTPEPGALVPPLVVDVGNTSVRVEEADTVVGASYGDTAG